MGDVNTVWNVRERLEENFRRVESILGEMAAQEDPKLRLAAAGELRQHIALAEKTLETAVRAETVRAFEDAVMDALDAAGRQVRRKVLKVLNERGSSAGLLCPPE